MIRLWVETDLSAGSEISLAPEQAHYLTSVMRRPEGAGLLLFNGRDGEWQARISFVSKKQTRLRVEAQTRPQPAMGGPILSVALIKRTRLESVIEKATELGASRIELLVTRYTQADHTRSDRLRAIAIEAAEQTGRLDVPEILAPQRFDTWLDQLAGGRLIFCDEASMAEPAAEACRSASDMMSGWECASGVRLLIGPEGGFAPEESERLRGLETVRRVNLGPRILRADTAVFAGLSLIQALGGDWRV